MEISEIRQHALQAIAKARQSATERRARADAAARDYERFLQDVAGPIVRQFAIVMKAEGFPFTVATPADALRLESGRTREDFIEIALDPSDPPAVVGRVSRERGQRILTTERPLRQGAGIADLDDIDVMTFLAEAIGPFVER